jgi:hypothetical protein
MRSLGFIVRCQLLALVTQLSLGACGERTPAEVTVADWYAPPGRVGTYPATRARIESWIAAGRVDSIRTHGWHVWAAVTARSSRDSLPRWESWYSSLEVFDPTDSTPPVGQRFRRGRDFELPRQIVHSDVGGNRPTREPLDFAEHKLSFSRYSQPTAQHIVRHRLYQRRVLASAHRLLDSVQSPIVARGVRASSGEVDPGAVVIKAVFQFIPGDTSSVVPYWDGNRPQTTTDTLKPTIIRWKQAVVVDPTRRLTPGLRADCTVNGLVGACPIVSVDDFYHIVLTARDTADFARQLEDARARGDEGYLADADSIRRVLRPGNVALLVGMHVITKETPDWTWQTFWWSNDPVRSALGRDRPRSIPAPWSHYDMDVAYMMTRIAYNPYLETNLGGRLPDSTEWTGVRTNCMSCHRRAAWQPLGDTSFATPSYGPAGVVSGGDSSIFAGFVKTDYLWSIAGRARR